MAGVGRGPERDLRPTQPKTRYSIGRFADVKYTSDPIDPTDLTGDAWLWSLGLIHPSNWRTEMQK